MITLGIETSCDETALALIRDGKLLHDVISSQTDIHSLFGGVVPEIASREHYRLIGRLFADLLKKTDLSIAMIDTVAVSRGPGLLGSLLVGLGFAKGLAAASNARLVGVNHLHAHLLAAGLEQQLRFPAVGLLVSGGHTHIYHILSANDFRLLGRTLDDAAGEAFDKVAKMLNMPYPGGHLIDRIGRMAMPDVKLFTKPYVDNDNLDFSFSGLKTAASLHIQRNPHLRFSSPAEAARRCAVAEEETTSLQELAVLCASFNHTVAQTLRIKMQRALERLMTQEQGRPVSLVVAGGVAANSMVREAMTGLAEHFDVEAVLPSLSLCTDNGAMVAYAGEQLARLGLRHLPDLEAIPRGQAIPDDMVRDEGACPAICGK
ncbi:tRNA (adenosine(37)-N6)-threonylcarbamoyltransferase complex transferase subunit TsaD [Desulfovibrio psychrotolerans]|uniref:tRNA N6-adenosine threonylcarbamoyltransferase n=1 Tax=Desulfovibrio psychrotolerans TaxID=415242 RepID=A0A7J0BPD4_9BACT|nr:tRNA (adenosine(37)-N6)-threonylcarbamoyltransferase complex transferase subunit TsaD [Desulfovibrio psychrotolerans]GFM35468.1 tRNA N6-adenosine threonylcarbamoyltransferase [Desulfovibrio psychrotolerans]